MRIEKMAKFTDNNQLNKDGYNRIHDSITNAKTMNSLERAVEASLQIIKDCHLDDYQVSRLEQYGMKKYEQLMIEMSKLDRFASTNKFRK